MIPKTSTPISSWEEGFTFIEVIISLLILVLLIGMVVHYHASAGASDDQKYYLKAVQLARAELQKLKALYEISPSAYEFADPPDSVPDDIFLFKFTGSGDEITLPTSVFRVYFNDDDQPKGQFLRPLGDSPPYLVNQKNKAVNYSEYYKEAYHAFNIAAEDLDNIDKRTFTWFTDDNNSQTNIDAGSGKIDASLVVIDDMGSPEDPDDDLLGNIGWWVETVDPNENCKIITFVLQFWYPGQKQTIDPEIIVLKTTLVKP